ncbi:MAG: UvrD-helicase domain-containing protein [Solirubrobacteraceae bacterium]
MTTELQAPPFDVTGPLPRGVTVLEASAGTGKTYAIAALAARYVADGIPLERVLLVTFTRMATGELRERVRERLLSVLHGLDQVLAGVLFGGDQVVELLAEGPEELVRRRRNRLARALANFDAATIATTHGFCQEVLGGLGIAADLEPNVEFVEDLSDLLGEVVDDLYVRRFHGRDEPPFSRAEALQIANIAVENPDAAIAAATGDVPEMRRRLALAVRQELEARKQRLAVMTYDDLLTRLDAVLSGSHGESIAARLQSRYDVVLVDEFQDTDPMQWNIMRRAFAEGERALVLIADPKQAIYAFRGADVYAYLDAARAAVTRATLTINWRSDQALIDAYDALFANAKLGDEGIVYRRVRAADANCARRLHRAPHGVPLRIRVVERESVQQTAKGFAQVGCTREHIARDLAGDAVTLLSSDAEIEIRSEDGAATRREQIHPGHIAVLVRTNATAALIRKALEDAGIPAVINGAGSVFATDTAREWLRLLEALERPTSITRAHSAALTCFLGWSPERVALADESEWEQVHQRLHDWAKVLRLNGVASLLQTISRVEGVAQRVLATADGERRLTDLRHIGQLLHAAASTEQLGTTALTGWLRRRIVESDRDTADEDRSRRLESDAEAVQVLTVHRSKGLEFPIVYLPFLWEPGHIPDREPVTFHDAEADNQRVLDVALEGPDFDNHRGLYVAEQRGEDLRLAYVALTRARHQAIVWWAGSWASRHSPLGRLLFARDGDGNVATAGKFTPDDAAAVRRFEEVAAEADGCVSVERSVLGIPSRWSPPLPLPAELAAAAFERTLDQRWRRTSYSDITAGSYDAVVASEAEEPVVNDEPVVTVPSPMTLGDGGAVSCPLANMGVGAEVGTVVHRALAASEFDAADLDSELERQLAAAQGRRAVDVGDPEAVVAGLRTAVETPLGPLFDDHRLCDVRRADRLDELEFELPLAGGDQPDGWLTLSMIGRVLRDHLPADDPLAGYAERLADPVLRQNVRGYLTGSLDLVVRIGTADAPRFAVLDYKTNWLGAAGEELTVHHYRPEALAAEMYRHHYALQALLYTVALHRYLRWRVPGYRVERNLAGVLYLFLRGMVGDPSYGVFAWNPPGALVQALSDALDRGGAR